MHPSDNGMQLCTLLGVGNTHKNSAIGANTGLSWLTMKCCMCRECRPPKWCTGVGMANLAGITAFDDVTVTSVYPPAVPCQSHASFHCCSLTCNALYVQDRCHRMNQDAGFHIWIQPSLMYNSLLCFVCNQCCGGAPFPSIMMHAHTAHHRFAMDCRLRTDVTGLGRPGRCTSTG